MLKVLFIFPDMAWNSLNFSPAILCLSAYLKAHIDADIKVMHINNQYGIPYDLDVIYKYVSDYTPDIIGVSSTSYTYPEVDAIAKVLKERGITVPIILGGAHAYTSPNDIETSHFNAFAIGESELSLLDFCERLADSRDYTSTPGFYCKTEAGVVRNPPAKALSNLDELPFLDYSILDIDEILLRRDGWLNIAFSRGCPYSCSFCINQKIRALFKECNSGSFYRCKSVDNALNELEALAEKYIGKIKVFKIDDDLPFIRKDWFLAFADGYRRRIFEPHGINYVLNGRANLISDEIIEALVKSGCQEIQIGFESGDSELRNRILNKEISDNDLLRTFGFCQRRGLRTLAYAMLGTPGETHASISKTLNMLCQIKPDLVRMTIFDPLVGTPIYDYCVEHDLIAYNKNLKTQFTASNIKFDDLSEHDIVYYHLMFPWELNIAAGIEIETYKALTEKYKALPYDTLTRQETRDEIIDCDIELSSALCERNIPHFQYCSRNRIYYEYYSGEVL